MAALLGEGEIRDERFRPKRGKNLGIWGHHGSRLMPGGGLEFWRPYSWQGGGGGSRGQGEWDEVLVDFRGHHSCPKFFGFGLAKGWLHVEIKKGMKELESTDL